MPNQLNQYGPTYPKPHKTTHQDGGTDEISVQGLLGLLADPQHVLDNEVTDIAIAREIVTTPGDIIYATAAATLTRLGLIANKHLIGNAAGNTPEYATPFKIGAFTRDTNLATGTQAITGVGFKPSNLLLIANVPATTQVSIGLDNTALRCCIINIHALASNLWDSATVYSIRLVQATGIIYTGTVSTLDSDGFTISWEKAGVKIGIANIFYMAFR